MTEFAVASATPTLGRAPAIPAPKGVANLAERAFDGEDLTALRCELIQHMIAEPENAAVLRDLSIIEQLTGDPSDAQALQYRALECSRLYRRPAACAAPGLRLLAFMAPGGSISPRSQNAWASTISRSTAARPTTASSSSSGSTSP